MTAHPGRSARSDTGTVPLVGAPLGWFTWQYAVRAGERTFANLRVNWFRSSGWIDLGGGRMQVRRLGFLGEFVLVDDGEVVGRARKPSVFRRAFELDADEMTIDLAPARLWSRTYLLREGGRDAGRIVPAGLWSRRFRAELPSWLAPELQAFALWLVLWSWRRQASSGS